MCIFQGLLFYMARLCVLVAKSLVEAGLVHLNDFGLLVSHFVQQLQFIFDGGVLGAFLTP